MKVLVALCLCGLSTTLFAQLTGGAYADSSYGVSINYRGNYRLKAGDLDENSTLGYLGPIPMEFAVPGGVRILTVQVPPDSYPGTDFTTAFVTVSANRHLTPDECDRFPDDMGRSDKPVTKRVGGMEFHGFDYGEGGLGHQSGGPYYHLFLEGVCYEVGEGIATAGYGAVDGLKQVDQKLVSDVLDKIAASITIQPPKLTASASPSIQSFALSPLPQRSPTGAYRVSWEVAGTKSSQVWLSTSCTGDLMISEVIADTPRPIAFPCGGVRPVASSTGSLDLEFRNLSGGEIQESVRLFAAGNPSVSKSIMITLPTLPVLIAVTTEGKKYLSPSDDTLIQIVAGHDIQIVGVGFLSRQTLWIGPTSLPIETVDGQSVHFTAPDSLPPGDYSMSIANARGRSNAVTVQLTK